MCLFHETVLPAAPPAFESAPSASETAPFAFEAAPFAFEEAPSAFGAAPFTTSETAQSPFVFNGVPTSPRRKTNAHEIPQGPQAPSLAWVRPPHSSSPHTTTALLRFVQQPLRIPFNPSSSSSGIIIRDSAPSSESTAVVAMRPFKEENFSTMLLKFEQRQARKRPIADLEGATSPGMGPRELLETSRKRMSLEIAAKSLMSQMQQELTAETEANNGEQQTTRSLGISRMQRMKTMAALLIAEMESPGSLSGTQAPGRHNLSCEGNIQQSTAGPKPEAPERLSLDFTPRTLQRRSAAPSAAFSRDSSSSQAIIKRKTAPIGALATTTTCKQIRSPSARSDLSHERVPAEDKETCLKWPRLFGVHLIPHSVILA